MGGLEQKRMWPLMSALLEAEQGSMRSGEQMWLQAEKAHRALYPTRGSLASVAAESTAKHSDYFTDCLKLIKY